MGFLIYNLKHKNCSMGACQSYNPGINSEQTIEQIGFQGNFEKLEDQIQRPTISQLLSDLIAIKRPFLEELNAIRRHTKITYKGGLYIGQISKFQKPNGWGKLYCENGDVLIGQFSEGQVEGKCFYGKSDGTYHSGEVIKGKLTCKNGIYYCPQFVYIGGFKQNLYHGVGRILKNNFILQGQFVQGKISTGKLQWKQGGQSYIYIGQFNQNMQMHGKGVLEQPYGTYTGEFKFNKKEGDGEYKYLNGNYYKGQYVAGRKKGYGELFSRYKEILFKGDFENDVPESHPDLLSNFSSNLSKKSKNTLKRVETIRSTNTQGLISSEQKIL